MVETSRAWGYTANRASWKFSEIYGSTRVQENAEKLYEIAEGKEGKGRKTKYFVMQWERGNSGNEHMQGGVYFHSATSLANAQAWLGDLFENPHMEKLANPAEYFKYCKKADTRRMKWMDWGEMPMENGKRKNWELAVEKSREGNTALVGDTALEYEYVKHHQGFAALQTLRMTAKLNREGWVKLDKKVVCIYGPPGMGKTVMVNIMGRAWSAQQGKSGYIMISDEAQWKGLYSNQDMVAIDECGMDGMPYKEMLECMNTSVCTVQVKGGHALWVPDLIVMISMYHPREWGNDRGWGALTTNTWDVPGKVGALQRRFSAICEIKGESFDDPNLTIEPPLPDYLQKLYEDGCAMYAQPAQEEPMSDEALQGAAGKAVEGEDDEELRGLVDDFLERGGEVVEGEERIDGGIDRVTEFEKLGNGGVGDDLDDFDMFH